MKDLPDESMSDGNRDKDAPLNSSKLVKDVRKCLEEVFEAHSKLVVGMNEWNIRDYFFRRAGTNKILLLMLYMMSYSEHAILRLGGFNKRRSLKRVDLFLGHVMAVLDDLALLKSGAESEISSVRDLVLRNKKQFPNLPHMKWFSAASFSAVFGAILLTFTLTNAIDPSGKIFFGLLTLAFFIMGVSALMAAVLFFGMELRLYLWYRKLLKDFDVIKKEEVTYRTLRKLTVLMNHELHKEL